MNKYGLKRYLAGAAVLLAAVIMIGVSFNRMKTRAAETENVEFKASGLAVEESFSDSGTVRFLIGQKNKN